MDPNTTVFFTTMMLVIFGITIAKLVVSARTAGVANNKGPGALVKREELEEISARLARMEDRLGNLETIITDRNRGWDERLSGQREAHV